MDFKMHYKHVLSHVGIDILVGTQYDFMIIIRK